jgi:hypothetical protein
MGKLVSHFFCLPIIVLGAVIVPVLCAIEYFLACNNNSGDIWNGRVRGDGKQRSERKREKPTNKWKKQQTNKQTKCFKDINRER